MDEHQLQDALKALIEEVASMDAEDRQNAGIGNELAGMEGVRTFEEEGVLTDNAGLVITTAGGREFQLTIVRSR